jgi:hypothetical protein
MLGGLQGQNGAGGIRLIKKCNDLVDNRSHDLLPSSLVPQPTGLLYICPAFYIVSLILYAEDGSRTVIRNVGKRLLHCTASHRRTQEHLWICPVGNGTALGR